MWTKICANTNIADARLAASLGADALGFVFAGSKRRVTATEVARITAELPPDVERVGVFDVQSASEIVDAVRQARLSGVQLHRELDRELVRKLSSELGPNVTITQTIWWTVDGGEHGSPRSQRAADEIRRQLERVDELPGIGRVLVDSRVGAASGGTGVRFPWHEAARVLAGYRARTGLIVAGGLRPENVADAIRTLMPWGVDVASGVEAEPGRKDPEKLAHFLCEARHDRRAPLAGS